MVPRNFKNVGGKLAGLRTAKSEDQLADHETEQQTTQDAERNKRMFVEFHRRSPFAALQRTRSVARDLFRSDWPRP